MKICSKCAEEKEYSEYHIAKCCKDGYRPECKTCRKKIENEYGSREDVRKRKKAYSKVRRDKAREIFTNSDEYKQHKIEKAKKSKALRLARQIRGSKKHSLKNPEKYHARKTLMNRVYSGKVLRPDKCSQCGSGKKIEAHHEDYDKPLDVEWLCRECHLKLHKNKKNKESA